MKGITKMTRERHRFSGWMVRAQRNGWGFRLYVSASSIHEKGNFNQRMAAAKKKALAAQKELLAVLATKKYWTKTGNLTPQALRFVKGEGFKVYPAPSKAKAK